MEEKLKNSSTSCDPHSFQGTVVVNQCLRSALFLPTLFVSVYTFFCIRLIEPTLWFLGSGIGMESYAIRVC